MANKKSVARRHHYIPQCYLKGFTKLGRKDSTFTVLGLKDGRVLPDQNLINFCQERDFNRGEYKTIDPNALETFLGEEVEPKFDRALRNIESTRKFEGEDRELILNLIAILSVRNPQRRNSYNEFLTYISKGILSFYAAQNVGETVNGLLITEEFKEIVNEDKFEIEVKAPRNQHIQQELGVLGGIIDSLAHRKWALIQAPDDEVFVTSDFPVALIWVESGERLPPGFALKNTEVHFALSKRFALVGSFEGEEETVIASEEVMALINSNIIAKANRWIFTAKDFYFLKPEDELSYGVEELFIF